jgi:uncharacterized protein YeaO (DUF488 family)
MEIRTRRIYDPPTALDGTRILVDGLWPRGISKQQARLDGWRRELAPSKALRQWFAHDPSRWEGFKERYFAKQGVLSALAETSGDGPLTLLFAARDPTHINAVDLREYLMRTA